MRPSLRRPQVWQTDYTSEELLELDGVAEGNDLREAVVDVGVVKSVYARLYVSRTSPDSRIGEDDFVILLEAILEAQTSAMAVAGRNGEVHPLVGNGAFVINVTGEDAPLLAELMLDTYAVAP